VRQDIIQLLDDWAAEERGRITTAEVRERLATSEQAASNLMSRLVKAGFLDRVARGVFASRPLGALGTRAASEDIALAVGAAFSDEPHRLAFRSALDHHGLLTYPTRTVQVAMPRRVKLQSISGRRLRVIHEAPVTVGIGTEAAGHGAIVSTVERALVESAARPALAGGWTTLATALNQATVDPEILTRVAEQLGAGPGLRRLGSLAEIHDLDGVLAGLRVPKPDVRLVPLDPQAPLEEPWVDPRWRVRWPTSKRDALQIVTV
jgi:predicted transcriptional regulator of viral defense system